MAECKNLQIEIGNCRLRVYRMSNPESPNNPEKEKRIADIPLYRETSILPEYPIDSKSKFSPGQIFIRYNEYSSYTITYSSEHIYVDESGSDISGSITDFNSLLTYLENEQRLNCP